MKKATWVLVLAAAVIAVGLPTARAIPPFQKAFIERYVPSENRTPEQEALAGAVETAKCNICHMGNDKKMRNAYGMELDALLDKKTDAQDVDKIMMALEMVEAIHTDAEDESSPTYGDRLGMGLLPVE